MFRLGKTSLKRLEGVNEDLVKVIKRAIEITPIDFTVLEGIRSRQRQVQLVATGKSKTVNSRHLTGHAVDVAPIEGGKIPWNDPEKFLDVVDAVFQAADELGVLVQSGTDWDMDGDYKDESFFDGPHVQIPWPHKLDLAKRAAERRVKLRQLEAEEAGLSADITPGLEPEDMDDSDYEVE